jgi:hypothetical protein
MSRKYELGDLLEFVNRFSIESSLSWTVPHLYKPKTHFEIYWIYDKTTQLNWYTKKNNDKDWYNMAAQDLLHHLIESQADLSNFELYLLRDICMQAVCSHYFVLKASELIGEDKINASIDVMLDLVEKKKNDKEIKKLKEKEKKATKLKLVSKKKKDDE